MNIRVGNKNDLPFLEQMLFEAFFWNANTPRPRFEEFIEKPEFKKLLANWGRAGDTAMIAEEGETPVGAAWYRFWSEADRSYGFVNSKTPEIGIAVHADHRSKGIGRALMRALIAQAKADGIKSISLSVDPFNFARQLYESEGFVKVGESGTSWTFMLQL